MNLNRFVVALALALSFVLAPSATFVLTTPTVDAQKKTVRVKEYTRKDGTVVKAHDRKATKPKTSTPKAEARASTPATIARDERGRIQRSAAARHAFARSTGFPSGRPGWIIDHIVPLACGGADAPTNMQWQTVAEAKAKDRMERVGCR